MINIKESLDFSSKKIFIDVYVYSNFTYTLNSTFPIYQNKRIEVPYGQKDITFTVLYGNGTSEIITHVICSKIKLYNFPIEYHIRDNLDHICVSKILKGKLQGWSTVYKTAHSTASLLFSNILLKHLTANIYWILNSGHSEFPFGNIETSISKDGIVSDIENVPLSRLKNFRIKPAPINRIRYSTGDNTIVSSTKKETINGDKNYLYSTKTYFSNLSSGGDIGRGYINTVDGFNYIFLNKYPIKTSVVGDRLIIENSEGESIEFYSDINIEKYLLLPTGDLFVVDSLSNLKYSKLEYIRLPTLDNNPSINNNRIIDIDNIDFFTNGDFVSIIINSKEIKKIGNVFSVEIENSIGQKKFISKEGNVINNRENIIAKDILIPVEIETDSDDDFIMIKVYIDFNESPYISYISALKLRYINLFQNITDIYSKDNSIFLVQNNVEKILSADFSHTYNNGVDNVKISI